MFLQIFSHLVEESADVCTLIVQTVKPEDGEQTFGKIHQWRRKQLVPSLVHFGRQQKFQFVSALSCQQVNIISAGLAVPCVLTQLDQRGQRKLVIRVRQHVHGVDNNVDSHRRVEPKGFVRNHIDHHLPAVYLNGIVLKV